MRQDHVYPIHKDFNPLPSCEGRPSGQSTPLIRGEPSLRQKSPRTRRNFNPLPSHEGRRAISSTGSASQTFQSTPLMRGETAANGWAHLRIVISIRSPLTRGDTVSRSIREIKKHFNPLPSHEGRQHKPPKIHPNLRQLTQQNHDTPLFGALQAPFCGAKPDIRGAKPTGKP